MAAYGSFAALYDLLMDDVDYDAWFADVRRRAAALGVTGGRACDAACGTGAFTLRLSGAGFSVVGVDLSADMLRLAADKARAAGRRITFVQQDMTALSLPRPVDLILCACDGVNYLTDPADVRRFFAAARANLRPGGAFLFDVSTLHKLSVRLGNHTLWELREEAAYLWQNAFDPAARLLTMDLTFFARQEGGLYRRFEERHVQRGHTDEELRAWLADAGFTRVSCEAQEDRAHYACA